MKKNVFKSALVIAMLFAGVNVNAQSNLGNILGGLLGKSNKTETATSASDNGDAQQSSSKSGLGSLVSGITSIFAGEKQVDEKNIIGTWEYTEPAIVLESEDFLSSTAGKVAAEKVENVLSERLQKLGVKAGSMTITFNEDGTFTNKFGAKTFKGKWSIENEKLILSMTGMPKLSLTTQLSGKELRFVVDAGKLLNLVKTLTGKMGSSSMQTVSALLDNVNGAQAGVAFVKK